ncbi:MAG: hypothetical protein ACFFCD_08120 [Promethearchaeota archaeon]
MFYIIFRFAKEYKHKKKLFNYLQNVGCEKLIKNLWKLPYGSVKRVKKQLNIHSVPYILLKRQRALEKSIRSQHDFRLGSLVLVAYSFPLDKSSISTRKYVSRLLRRSPYLKITRNIYAWPQINFKKLIPQGSKIISPKQFLDGIKELGGETIIVSRIIVEEKIGLELIETVKDIRANEFASIELACKKLTQQLRESAISVFKAKHSFNELKIRFIQTKEISFFLKRIYKLDLMKEYRKTLRAINNCKKVLLIQSKMPTVSVAD